MSLEAFVWPLICISMHAGMAPGDAGTSRQTVVKQWRGVRSSGELYTSTTSPLMFPQSERTSARRSWLVQEYDCFPLIRPPAFLPIMTNTTYLVQQMAYVASEAPGYSTHRWWDDQVCPFLTSLWSFEPCRLQRWTTLYLCKWTVGERQSRNRWGSRWLPLMNRSDLGG